MVWHIRDEKNADFASCIQHPLSFFSETTSVLQAWDNDKHDNSIIRELIKTIDCLISEHAVKIKIERYFH